MTILVIAQLERRKSGGGALGGQAALRDGVILQFFVALLRRFFGGPAAVRRDRVLQHLRLALLGQGDLVPVHIAPRLRPVDEALRPEVGRVRLRAVLVPQGHGGVLLQRHAGERIDVLQPVAQCRDAAALVLHLHAAEHQQVIRRAVIIEAVAPGFLALAQAVDVVAEEEGLVIALIPAAAGREHPAVLPEVDLRQEIGPRRLGIVAQLLRAHEDGVREHVDVAVEVEHVAGVLIGAFVALDDLPVGADHRRAAGEDGQAVLRVVVQGIGAEDIVPLVAQLDHAAAELREALVDQVIQLAAGQHGLALREADVAETVDEFLLHVPEGRVAGEIGAVMQESRVDGLARHTPVLLHLLQGDGVEQAYQRVCLPGILLGRQRQRCEQQGCEEDQSSFLILADHPFRENSQSPNRGSMIM